VSFRPLILALTLCVFYSCEARPEIDHSLPNLAETNDRYETRQKGNHYQSLDGNAFAREFNWESHDQVYDEEVIFADVPDPKPALSHVKIKFERASDDVVPADVRREFVTSMLPTDSRKISSVGNGSFVTL